MNAINYLVAAADFYDIWEAMVLLRRRNIGVKQAVARF